LLFCNKEDRYETAKELDALPRPHGPVAKMIAARARSGLGSRGWGRKGLEFLAGLEANCFAGRDIDLLARTRVPPDASLARFHIEDPEAAKLDAFPAAERVFHSLEDGFDRLLGFGPGDICFLYDSVDEVELDHNTLPRSGSLC
jgi:hypothetical protein